MNESRRSGSTVRAVAAATLASLLLSIGCADSGFDISDDGYVVPATIDDMLPIANQIAMDWDENAYLWRIGGGVTVVDSLGRGYNHSFRYYSIPIELILDLHFFAGAHWAEETPRPRTEAPAPLFGSSVASGVVDPTKLIPSPEAIGIALDAGVDSVLNFDVTEYDLSVRLLSHPVWPERVQAGQQTDSLAWRVDFMQQHFDPGQTPEWWSFIRVYVHPETGELFEVIDNLPNGQKYPNL